MRGILRLTLGLLLVTAPATAQIGNPSDFNNRLLRLENEIETLSRQVYRGGDTGAPGTPGGQSMPPVSAANMELRLSQLEAQLRQLTGQVEQQGFLLNQLRDQLNRLTTDLDFRLRALESGPGSTAGTAPQAAQTGAGGNSAPGMSPSADPQIAEGTAAPPAGQQAAVPDMDAAGASVPGQTLGTLPADNDRTASATFNAATPEALYEEAFAALGRVDYGRAEALFVSFLEQHPDHRLSGNARYWLSESYFARGDLERAAVGFAEGYQLQPDGPKAADNLLKLGVALGRLGRTEQACSTLAQLAQQFPDLRGTIARRAQRESSALGCG